MAMPVCKDVDTVFDDVSKIKSIDDYLGDPEDADWIYSGYVDDYDGASIMAMPNQTSGTVVSSTRYVWYGKVSATFKTSRGGGVVTAFIMFSNSQDEIDWEFLGYNLTRAETNFYYEGILNNTNVFRVDLTDTFTDYHTFEVDWTEDTIEWYVDGELLRTLDKEDTYNETSGKYMFPQTPSRVQFSLWPGGDTGAVGTTEWAGGEVDWDSEDMEEYGYYYAILQNATIECYDPPSGTLTTGDSAYIYNSTSGFGQDTIVITNNSTVLCDSDSSGLDSDDCASSASSSSSSSKKSSSTSGSSTKTSGTKSGTKTSDLTTTATGTEESTTSSIPTSFVQFIDGTSSSNVGVLVSGSLASVLVSALAAILM